jgi:hypothetical protein
MAGMSKYLLLFLSAPLCLLALACSSEGTPGGQSANLEPVCVDDPAELDGWLCPEPLEVECEDGEADPDLIYFTPEPPEGETPPACDELEYALNDEGPFELGEHEIVINLVEDGELGAVLCETTLTVQDKEFPEGNDEAIELWPPNHKFHTISGEDCVQDLCDEDLDVTFLSATSDEPVNDKGDGNTDPDIILECDSVQLRAERQGGSNGRVYTLAWRAVDDSGNASDGECIVTVPHDQSGEAAVDDGPAYELTQGEGECDDGTGGEGGAGGAGGASGAGGAGGAGGSGGAGGDDGEGGAGGALVP